MKDRNRYPYILYLSKKELDKHCSLLAMGANIASYILFHAEDLKAIDEKKSRLHMSTTDYGAIDAISDAKNWNTLCTFLTSVYTRFHDQEGSKKKFLTSA
jgi:hypothetical protein